MGDVASEVFSNNDVPRRTMPPIKLLLDLGSDVLLDVEFFECGRCDINTLLLHLFAHVYIFYDGFWCTVGIAIPWHGTGVG